VGIGEVAERARVGVAGEDPGESLDQVAEADRADAGADADEDRQRDQEAVLTAEPVADPRQEAGWETGVRGRRLDLSHLLDPRRPACPVRPLRESNRGSLSES
jgi:hypothetical protein